MIAPLTDDHIRAYQLDGVVCLRGAIDQDWIDQLRRGLDKNIESPSERARLWDCDAQGRTMFYDSQTWRTISEYRAFVHDSPMGELAATLMGSERVNFFFDAVFARSAGSQFRTPFHQDEPYWSVKGFDCCSAWMPLVPVTKSSALEFVAGSHHWGDKFRQQNFGALTGDQRDQVVFGDDAEPFPDIEADRDSFDMRAWDMEPGDVAFFNGRTAHGGSGRLDPNRDLQVFTTKWLGDDVRVCFRQQGMDPDHSEVMRGVGLAPGDRVGTELYPEVWRA